MTTAVESVAYTVNDLKDQVLGTGETANGTANQQVTAQSGEEPVSGVQGKGTVSDPYDRGNAMEPAELGQEPPSGVQGKGTATEPYDGGNAPENEAKLATQSSETPSQAPPSQPSGNSTTPANPTSTAPPPAAEKSATERGRSSLQVPSKSKEEDREVSPGTLPDGTHAQTSGDRGESYEVGKFHKFKGKLTSLGRH